MLLKKAVEALKASEGRWIVGLNPSFAALIKWTRILFVEICCSRVQPRARL